MSDNPIFDDVNKDHNTFPTFDDVNKDHSVEESKAPKAKVVGATVGSGVGFALAVILSWVLAMFGIDTPSEVRDAFGIVLVAGLTFIGGYYTKER